MHNAKTLWETCSELIKAQVSEVVWNTTFRELEAVELTDSELTISVPSRVVKDRIEARYIGIVKASLVESNNGPLAMELKVRMDEQTLLGLNSTVIDLTTEDPRIEVQMPEVADQPLPTLSLIHI